MKLFLKSSFVLIEVIRAAITGMLLAAVFSTPAWADRDGGRDGNRFEGGRDRQVEKKREKQIERRDERRIDRQQDRRMDRIENRQEQRQEHRINRAHVWRGDIHNFNRHDLPRWRGGTWRHARHNGELAWWWVVGGLWYFYPQPIYPYPDPYMPPVVVTQTVPVETSPSIVVAPAATSQSWYYCESTNGYYPYTASCAEGWKTVPATPPTTTPSTQ